MTVHLVFPDGMTFQRNAMFLHLAHARVPQGIHVPEDEVRDYVRVQGVSGSAIGGQHEVRSFGDAPEKVWLLGSTV